MREIDLFVELDPLVLRSKERDAWRAGELAGQWQTTYPRLFDAQDLQLARNRGWRRHYYEWASALHFYMTRGWYSLVAKYEFSSHDRKRRVAERILKPDVMAILRDREKHGPAQAPDLFVYSPDETDYFFCEVKGPGDSLHVNQRRKFGVLARVTRRPIRILKCRVCN
jgi:hypothetical protein